MTPEEYVSMLKEVANVKDRSMPGLVSEAQRIAIILLFKQYAEFYNIGTMFAAISPPDWLRHRVLELLFGQRSSLFLTSGQASMLLDEFGAQVDGKWIITDTGQHGMEKLIDILARHSPTQIPLIAP